MSRGLNFNILDHSSIAEFHSRSRKGSKVEVHVDVDLERCGWASLAGKTGMY